MNKAFNLFDLGLKKAGKIQLFDKNSLDSEGNIIPFETQTAIVSHYIQNEDSDKSSNKNERKTLVLIKTDFR